MSYRDLMYWFGRGRLCNAVILLKNGDVVNIDFSSPDDRKKASDSFNEYAGHVIQIIHTPKGSRQSEFLWMGEAPNPVNPDWLVRVPTFDPNTTYGYKTAGEALTALVKKTREEGDKEAAIRANPATLLERELKSHDWFACYSDSPGVSAAGDRHWDMIQSLRKLVEPPIYDELFAKYAPKEMK